VVDVRTIPEFTGRAPNRPAAPKDFRGISGALGSIGNSLGKVEERINNSLDKQAAIEGRGAGIAAGQADELALMTDKTIRGRAFNQAALSTFQARSEIKISGELDAAFKINKNDPNAVQAAFDDIRVESLKGSPDQAAPGINNLIDKRLLVALEASGRIHEENVLSANRASAADQLTALSRSIEQSAFVLTGDERAASMVIDGFMDFKDALISYGPRGEFEFDGETFPIDPARTGVFRPEDMQRMMQQLNDGVIENKVLGKFDRAPGVAAKMAVRDSLRPAWAEGDLDLSEASLTSLENRLDGDIRALRTENSAGNRALANKVTRINSLVEKGFSIRPDDWSVVQAEVAANGDTVLAETLENAKALSLWQNELVQLTPVELQSVVNEQRNSISSEEGIRSFEQVRRLEVSERLLTEMKRELNRDPISWATRVGIIKSEPLTLEGPEALDSMERRHAQGLEVAAQYGIEAKFLTDEEVSGLSVALPEMTVDNKILLANTISGGFGPDAGSVLERVADDNGSFAHVGGLVHNGSQGNVDVARRILQGNLARVGQKTNILPPKSDLAAVFSDVAGTALATSVTRETVIDAAKDLYTQAGLLMGLTSDEFDDELYAKSLNEAAGAVFINGTQYGGFADYQGNEIVLPRNMTIDEFDDRLSDITDDEIKSGIFVDIPRHVNGTIATADEINDGLLIPVGEGVYAVARNEDGTGLFVGSIPNQPFLIDINGLNVTSRSNEVPQLVRSAPVISIGDPLPVRGDE